MACIHCGSTTDLLPRKNRVYSGVCVPCRRAQKNAARTRTSSPRLIKYGSRHVRPAIPKPIVETDMQAAIRRAQEKARKLNIPLSEALAAEGV